MGMAASQARLLNLTARKTNLEYEGQQINQQRTNLSNSSATYYNEMLQLTVPTPPSSDNYKTIKYTFTLAGTEYTIDQATSNTMVTTYENQIDGMQKSTQRYYVYDRSSSAKLTQNLSDVTALSSQADEIVNLMKRDTGDTTLTKDNIQVLVKNPGTSSVSYQYFTPSQMTVAQTEAANGWTEGYSKTTISNYQQQTFTNVSFTRDKNNRICNVTIPNYTDEDGVSVTSTTISDEDAYEDAYNEYEYQTYLYEQKMNDINAQTSVIQAKDKQLELRLKQIDTEQSAVSTEIESVKSVCDKNVEDTFKTFA